MTSALSLCGNDDVFEETKKQAAELLKKNWPAIEAVAKELIKRGKLSYSEVKELINIKE